MRLWFNVEVAPAATGLAAVVSPATFVPVASSISVVIVTDWELVDWFSTSAATETVADVALTEGVVMNPPL